MMVGTAVTDRNGIQVTAPIAQLDRVLASEAKGRAFEPH